jgi:hypothetical protein
MYRTWPSSAGIARPVDATHDEWNSTRSQSVVVSALTGLYRSPGCITVGENMTGIHHAAIRPQDIHQHAYMYTWSRYRFAVHIRGPSCGCRAAKLDKEMHFLHPVVPPAVVQIGGAASALLGSDEDACLPANTGSWHSDAYTAACEYV